MFKEGLKIKPNYSGFYFNLGNIFFQKKQYELVVKCFEKITKLEGCY